MYSYDDGSVWLDGPVELWSLREDVAMTIESGDGAVRLHSRWGSITVRNPTSPVQEALQRMRLGPISLENVLSRGPAHEGSAQDSAERKELSLALDRLQPLVVRSLSLGSGQLLLSVVPTTSRSQFRPVPVPPETFLRLSKFAQFRTSGHEYVLESPLAQHRVLLHRGEAVRLLGLLGRPLTAAEAARAWPAEGGAEHAISYLVATGMVLTARPPAGMSEFEPVFAEDNDPALSGWSAVDLMFHSRSTFGLHDIDVGGVYPFGRERCPEPVVKPPPADAGPGITLRRPRWEDLCSADPPLIAAVEGRASARDYSSGPVPLTELGELLYRTARIRSLIAFPPAGPGSPRAGGEQEAEGEACLSDRPYPGAGGCHELEIYVMVSDCPGLPPGVYHYDPLGHELEPVATEQAAADTLMRCASVAMGADDPPPVLLTIAARFRRLSWKYAGIPYSLALMDVGVLIHSLYLTCTAMRLGACAIGSVHADAAARAFGNDWLIEPSIAQFAIGADLGGTLDDDPSRRPANDADWRARARSILVGGSDGRSS
ncbi:MAG: SagB/ThcOx family dehydrogenase [Trebonia sp.]